VKHEIKTVRESIRISQAELSRVSGVSRFRLNLFEQGHGDLKLGEVAKLKTALKKLCRCEKCLVEGSGL
jgi:predicted transcriptional regulator